MSERPKGVCPFCLTVRPLRWEGDRWVLQRHVGVESVVCDGTGEEPDPLGDCGGVSLMRAFDKAVLAYCVVVAAVSGSIFFAGMIRLVLP